MSPRQLLTPAPYAIFADTASNLAGTLPTAQLNGFIPATQLSGLVNNNQLANNAITINPGAGLSGGGLVALGGSTILNNTGVLSITSGADVTASTVNGAVTLGDNATSANTPGALVKRDASGNFSAGAITGDGSGLTNVNAATVNGLSKSNLWQLGGNDVAAGQFVGSTNNQPLELWANGARVLRLEPGDNFLTQPNLIGGCSSNAVDPGVIGSTIAGGGTFTFLLNAPNRISADFGFIGGGESNWVQTAAFFSTIGGGESNWIQTAASFSTIGGGRFNNASGAASTVPGGSNNAASGNYSFAAGQQARALHQGAFVWADSQDAPFASTANDQFNVRAAGGMHLETAGAGMTIDGQPVTANTGSIPDLQVFDTSGTFQFVVPAGVSRLMIELWGGGGGGGDGYLNGSTNYANGSGGGGGGYGKGVYNVTGGTSYTVVVGVGGGSQRSGGVSSVGNLISATGGSPGTNGIYIAYNYSGNVGGSSAAPINITGATGVWQGIITYSGAGGGAGCGGSGGRGGVYTNSPNADLYPEPGYVPGGGGSGGYSHGEFYDGTGAAGGHGRVIIFY
jgi:hypothetical protein